MAEIGFKEGLQVLLPIALICVSDEAHSVSAIDVQEEDADDVGLAYKKHISGHLNLVVFECFFSSANGLTIDSVEVNLRPSKVNENVAIWQRVDLECDLNTA